MVFTKKQLFEWSIFAVVGFIVCMLLAYRTIPSLESENDTGRYVGELHAYCTNTLSDLGLHNRQISFEFFYFFVSPSCWFESDQLFLFLVSSFVPLMFLIFSPWRNGTLLWACSLLFSIYGIELMVNAMRQGLAMLLFFGGLSLLKTHTKIAFTMGLCASVAHTSVFAFMPLMLWLSGIRLQRNVLFCLISFFIFSIVIILVVRGHLLLELYKEFTWLIEFYAKIYKANSNVLFILFIMLPVYFIYVMRFAFEKKSITQFEKKSFLYSNALFVVAMILYPAIAYRFAIFAVPLQIFLVAISVRPSVKAGSIVLLGMSFHLIVMLIMSTNYLVLFYG